MWCERVSQYDAICFVEPVNGGLQCTKSGCVGARGVRAEVERQSRQGEAGALAALAPELKDQLRASEGEQCVSHQAWADHRDEYRGDKRAQALPNVLLSQLSVRLSAAGGLLTKSRKYRTILTFSLGTDSHRQHVSNEPGALGIAYPA